MSGNHVFTWCLLLAVFVCEEAFAFSYSQPRPFVARHVTLKNCVGAKPRTRTALSMTDQNNTGKRVPLILCPAQFGVPADYEEIVGLLRTRGFETYVAPLSRLDWLRIVPSTDLKDYLAAELKPSKTLGFYYKVCKRLVFFKRRTTIASHELFSSRGRMRLKSTARSFQGFYLSLQFGNVD
jgi:hypothetical protein